MTNLHVPIKRIGTTVRLARGGGFDLRGCPDPEVLAFTIVRAVNAYEPLVTVLKAADNKLQAMREYHAGKSADAIDGLRTKIAEALIAAGAV